MTDRKDSERLARKVMDGIARGAIKVMLLDGTIVEATLTRSKPEGITSWAMYTLPDGSTFQGYADRLQEWMQIQEGVRYLELAKLGDTVDAEWME